MTSKLKIAAYILLMVAATACKKSNVQNEISQLKTPEDRAFKSSEKYNVFKGPQMSIGNGKVRSWISVSHENVPNEIGIEFTPAALTGLPEHGENHYIVPLHLMAKKTTLYDHIALNWNPEGHQPANIFNLPHFDAHFMRMTNEERMAIPEYSPGSAFDILPAATYRPAGYIPLPGGIAAMGKHWGALPFPAPGTFTDVLIYGSYDGKMIFEEPMVTLAHMLNGGASNIAFGQPQQFHTPGYYPTKYNVYQSDDGNYQITLSEFVLR